MGEKISTALAKFFRWWGEELRNLLPRPAARARANKCLIIAVDGSRKTLLLEKGARDTACAEIAEAEEGLSSFVPFAAARPGLPIGLRLSASLCFSRALQLPAQAEGDFGRILDLEMERTTPFRSADVLTAFYVEPGEQAPRGKRAVRHLMVKRKTIEPLLAEMRSLGMEPAFADCWDEERRGGLPIDFLASRQADGQRRGFLPARGMAGLCLLLAASAAAIPIMRHQTALQALEARVVEARAEAAATRQLLEVSQSAAARMEAVERRMRGRLPVAHILETLTATIPDSAWVSDLRIEGDMVEFTGFAKSAASLIPLLEASPLFTEAALTSPVVLDNNEDKERFSARLRVSLPGRVAAAGEAAAQAETEQ